MVLVRFPYGKNFLETDLPSERTVVLTSKPMTPIHDWRSEIYRSLRSPIGTPPLSKLVSKVSNVLVIIPDITRACPTRQLLKPLLNVIHENSDAHIRILIANGLHRPVEGRELEELVGKDIISEYEILNHDAKNEEEIIRIGRKTSFETPVALNKYVLKSDLVIGIGLIEPHFFAGYSGGRKALLPGVASADAIFSNHRYEMIAHPKARAGILDGNPIHEDMIEFMKLTKLDFILNVTITKEKKIAGIFAGDPIKAHLAGVRALDKHVKVQFESPAEIVITTNGGYPLDRDIYQAVKGMDTAASVVKNGGVIIMASECRDGLGGHEEFLKLVRGTKSPGEIIERIKNLEPIYDQWEAQILARVLQKAKVIMVTKGLSPSTLKELQLIPAKDLEEALEIAENLVGRKAKIAAIPEGPYIIPLL